jgi:hypothetical protein
LQKGPDSFSYCRGLSLNSNNDHDQRANTKEQQYGGHVRPGEFAFAGDSVDFDSLLSSICAGTSQAVAYFVRRVGQHTNSGLMPLQDMRTDSLKLVDMMWLDEEISSGRPLRHAWGDEEIFLDYWGCYEQVFDGRPEGSVSSRELLQPEEEGTFLLLRAEHVDQIIKSLYRHLDELRCTTKEQLSTLEKWKSLSLANHQHMVAYIFNRSEECGSTAARAQPAAAGVASPDISAGERGRPSDVAPDQTKVNAGIEPVTGTYGIERLKVKTRNLQFILVILLGVFMIPLGLLLVINELSKGAKLTPAMLMIGLMTLITYGAVAWLFRRGHVKSVKYFSDEGLVLNDGRSFAWTDLSRVVDRIRLNRVTGIKFIWRTEIQFTNGESAWLLPTKISNFPEVYELLRSLACEHVEET